MLHYIFIIINPLIYYKRIQKILQFQNIIHHGRNRDTMDTLNTHMNAYFQEMVQALQGVKYNNFSILNSGSM